MHEYIGVTIAICLVYCRYLFVSCVVDDTPAVHVDFKLNSSAHTTYIAFSSGLTIGYSIPTEFNFSQARFDLVELDQVNWPGNTSAGQVILHIDLPSEAFGVGEFTFDCGVVDKAGSYRGRLQVSAGPLDGGTDTVRVETGTLTVVWPRLSVSAPAVLGALEGPVDVELTTATNQPTPCEWRHDNVSFAVETIYIGRKEMKNGVRVVLPRTVVHRDEVPSLKQLVDQRKWTVPCEAFDQAGVYQSVVVRTDVSRVPSSVAVVAVGNEVNVSWSSVYSLSTDAVSVLPCETGNHMVVRFTQPRCAGKDDKVRLYRRVQRTGPAAAAGTAMMSFNQKYVLEQRTGRTDPGSRSGILPGSGEVRFDCDMFNVDEHDEAVDSTGGASVIGGTGTETRKPATGYCFIYVSTANSGAVTEQKTMCLPTYNNQSGFLVDGAWSTWSSWSACSVTCGRGRRSRYRVCDNPPPTAGGRFCDGAVLDWEPCQLHPCIELATVTSVSRDEGAGPGADEVDSTCECGCQLSQPYGQILAPADHRCSPPNANRRLPIVWHIVAEPRRVVQLTYRLLAANSGHESVPNPDSSDDHEDSEISLPVTGSVDSSTGEASWVRIRDGLEPASAKMLAIAFGNGNSAPKIVTSSTRHVTVEYQAPLSGSDGGGFMASYITVADNATLLANDDERKLMQSAWLSSWHSIVTVSGITFGALVVLLTLAFLCYHRVASGPASSGGRSRPLSMPRRPRKTQVGNAQLIKPLVGDSQGDCGGLYSREGSGTFWGARNASNENSPTRSFLLGQYRAPSNRNSLRSKDGLHQFHSRVDPALIGHDVQFVETNVDMVCSDCLVQRPGGAHYNKIYGFPCATYSGSPTPPLAEATKTPTFQPFSCQQLVYEQPMCHPYHAVACVNCSLRRSRSPTCSGCSAPLAAVSVGQEVFIDRPPPAALCRPPSDLRKSSTPPRMIQTADAENKTNSGKSGSSNIGGVVRQRPPVDGSDSEATPAMHRSRKCKDSPTGSARCRGTADRPDGQSPSEATEQDSVADSSTPSVLRRLLATSNGTLSDLVTADNNIDELEYDDIPPTLPGSYFEMDPQAYTLTWSKQAPAASETATAGTEKQS